MKIVILDEYPAILIQLESLIKETFPESSVFTFSNFDLCINFIHESLDIDLIISDLKCQNKRLLLNIQDFIQNKIPCIIYTGNLNPEILFTATKLNVKAIVSKSSDLQEIQRALNSLDSDKIYCCKTIQNKLQHVDPKFAEKPFFKEREIDVIQYATDGLSVPEIADKMCVSEHAVRAYRKNMISRNSKNFYSLIKQYIFWYGQ